MRNDLAHICMFLSFLPLLEMHAYAHGAQILIEVFVCLIPCYRRSARNASPPPPPLLPTTTTTTRRGPPLRPGLFAMEAPDRSCPTSCSSAELGIHIESILCFLKDAPILPPDSLALVDSVRLGQLGTWDTERPIPKHMITRRRAYLLKRGVRSTLLLPGPQCTKVRPGWCAAPVRVTWSLMMYN